MAIYRNVSLTFWTDNKIVDDFTTDDRYFFLYLLTNPHTNLIGCYEVSIKQMSNEFGYEEDKVEELLIRLEQIHKVIIYAEETKELLIKNWHKYNWTKSSKLKKPIKEGIEKIKSKELKKYMVSIGYIYGIDTTDTDPDTVTDSDFITDPDINLNNNNIFFIIEDNFGRPLGSLEIDVIKSWIEENISEELIIYAIKIAICNNAPSIRYISVILESWKKKNITTIEQAKIESETFKKEKDKFKNNRNVKDEPAWLNQNVDVNQASEEEQKEIKELLKEL